MTLKGKWRIVEMALWDLDFLDMMEPAYIFSTTKPGASSPSAASPAKSTAARPRLHLYRPTLADFFNSLLELLFFRKSLLMFQVVRQSGIEDCRDIEDAGPSGRLVVALHVLTCASD